MTAATDSLADFARDQAERLAIIEKFLMALCAACREQSLAVEAHNLRAGAELLRLPDVGGLKIRFAENLPEIVCNRLQYLLRPKATRIFEHVSPGASLEAVGRAEQETVAKTIAALALLPSSAREEFSPPPRHHLYEVPGGS